MTAPKRAHRGGGGSRFYLVDVSQEGEPSRLEEAPGASSLTKLLANDAFKVTAVKTALDHYSRTGDFGAAVKSIWGTTPAAKRGNEIHEITEKWDKGVTIPPTLYQRELEGWRAIVREFGLEIEHNEMTAATKRGPIAGTLDRNVHSERLSAEFGPGPFILDLKSGDSGVWPDVAIQLSALANMEGALNEDGSITPFAEPPNREWAFVAHLPSNAPPTLVPVAISAAWPIALTLAEIWHYRRKDEKTVLRDPLRLGIHEELERLTRACRMLKDRAPQEFAELQEKWPVPGKRLSAPDWTEAEVASVWELFESLNGVEIEKLAAKFGAKAGK